MKTILLTLMLASAVLAADPVLPKELTTLKGKTFTDVKLTSVDPDGVHIMHAGGVAKIMMEDLPEALRTSFHFDAKKAEKFRRDLATAQKTELRKREAASARDNQIAADNHRALAAASAAAAEAAKESAGPPAPIIGTIYTVTEVAAHKADLRGKVFRIRLFYNTESAPVQQDDGSLKMFVTGSGSYDYVTFPRAGMDYVRTFLKSNLGQMTFYAAVSDDGIGIVGRGYDAQRNTYTW